MRVRVRSDWKGQAHDVGMRDFSSLLAQMADVLLWALSPALKQKSETLKNVFNFILWDLPGAEQLQRHLCRCLQAETGITHVQAEARGSAACCLASEHT